jgi:hypothetical protein
MSQFYRVLKADPLGDPWESHGKQNQSYWCQVENEELPVKISKQVGNTLSPGDTVYGDLMKATSQKGTSYWKFQAAKVPEGTARPASIPALTQPPVDMSANQPEWFKPWANVLTDMHKMIKEMYGVQDEDTLPEPPAGSVVQLAGEPLSDEAKAQLNSIFGPEPEV